MKMSEAVLDVNVLIAAHLINHADHARASRFVDSLDRFYTTPITQGGWLRFLTRPWKNAQGEPQPPRMMPADALAALVKLTAHSRHAFLPDDLSFEAVSLKSLSGHRQWTDGYLMALARKHRLKLATFETKLDNMDDPSDPVLDKIS
jgi:toxin-antitoxin system PIN domain toxin